mgnify:CR=1 FL=1
MPIVIQNPWRGRAMLPDAPLPSSDATSVAHLLGLCPVHKETPLLTNAALAEAANVDTLWIKDERQRMGLGSFKALGAAFAIAREAQDSDHQDWQHALKGRTFVAASAGTTKVKTAATASVADWPRRLAAW